MNGIHEKRVIRLAYLHHWGWLAAFLIGMVIWTRYMWEILILCSAVNLIWSIIGYRRKWRHIFCSNQISKHEVLTPYSVFWDRVDKTDIYGVPMIFIVIGLCGRISVAMGW